MDDAESRPPLSYLLLARPQLPTVMSIRVSLLLEPLLTVGYPRARS
jgi:hypothetical protein